MNASPARTAEPQVNISRVVSDFVGISDLKAIKLRYVAEKVSIAAYGGPFWPSMLTPSDFAVLEAFVAHARADFALAGIAVPDTAVDQQFSADESHFMDRERI